MLQIATFKLPEQQVEANAFLAEHKPSGEISFNNDHLFIGYDDGTYPDAHKISDLQALLGGNRNAKFQQQIAIHVMQYELADEKKGSDRFAEINKAIRDTQRGINIQDVKAAFVEARIAELQSGNGNGSNTTDTATQGAKKGGKTK